MPLGSAQPTDSYSTHFSKLIFVSQQEYLLALQYGPQEMIPVNNLRLAKDSASG